MATRPELLARYGTAAVPRYTSYPSANVWPEQTSAFARDVFGRAGTRPVSLYVHVPFCRKLCFYCGCNMMVTSDDALVERYLAALDVEIGLTASVLGGHAPAVQLHLGGGTPTFLSPAQLERLVEMLKRRFTFAPDIEASIEVHPAVTRFEQVDALARLGFNRISMGVQDFDPETQQRVNRIQPFEDTRDLVAHARRAGFASVNIDLMYGLPLQTVERFQKTLDRVLEIRPDRIALFGYAHMPKLKKHMRLIQVEELPGPAERLGLLEGTIARLLGAGYVYVGLDHFALADDELCHARASHTLRRNFMGYTTCAESDVLAFGPSSISEVNGAYVQNEREVRAWAERLEQGGLPCVRGYAPTPDDDQRRALIMQLFCDLDVDTSAWRRAHGVEFDTAFARELPALDALARDGLVVRGDGHVRVTPQGQLFLRNVAAVFDAWLKPQAQHSTAV